MPTSRGQDTPALSPHRRSDTLPGFDVRSLPAAAAAATSYTQRYTHDDIARGSQSSAGPFRSPRSYDHSRATRLRRTPRDATVVIAERRVLRDQAYGSRIPQVRPGQRQSVYDWAPVPPAGEDDLAPESRALPQPFGFSHLDDDDIRFTASPGSMASPMELGAMMSRHARYSDLGREPGHGVPASTTAGESTFRMAVMQSLRNNAPHQHRSSRTATHSDTTTWGGSEREHLRERREETGNSSSRSRLDPAFSSSPLRYSRHRNGLRSHPCLPSASRGVARVINYLSKIRDCPAPEDSMRMAIKTGFYTREEWIEILDDQNRSDDVILDTLFLRTPETSWLKPGGVFWGSQVAPPNLSSSARSSISHSGEGDSIGDTGASNTNQWSVKVCISSIDYDQLRLSKSSFSPPPKWPHLTSLSRHHGGLHRRAKAHHSLQHRDVSRRRAPRLQHTHLQNHQLLEQPDLRRQ